MKCLSPNITDIVKYYIFSYFLKYACNVLKVEYMSLFQVSLCIVKQYGSF